MYSRENYKQAREEIEARRKNAVATAEARNAELDASYEDFAKIDDELSKTGLALFKVACSGGDIEKLRLRNEELIKKRGNMLAALGLPRDYTTPQYVCKICSDTGFVDTRMCTCLKQLLIMKNIRSSGMGHLIDKQSFENFDLECYKYDEKVYSSMEKILAKAKNYAKRFASKRSNLLFIGSTGTGKTHISTAIAKEVISQGFDVLYDSAQNIISCFEDDKFRGGYNRTDEPESNKYLECELLIIDDLGTEFVTQFSTSTLYNLLNTRQNKGLATIISTNLTGDELSAKYDGRICSRIVGTDYDVVIFKGEDHRIPSAYKSRTKKQ